MEEIRNETAVQTADEPQEVVLQYVAQPRGVESCYVQPRPLPGKRTAAGNTAAKKRAKKGLRIFLACLLALLAVAAIAVGYFWRDISAYFRGESGCTEDNIYIAGGGSVSIINLESYPADESRRLTYEIEHGEELNARDVYEKVAPSTVVVAAGSGELNASTAIGTGIILTEDGYILTNYHVIDRSSKCWVFLWDDTMFEAQLVGYGVKEDLAILKIDAEGLRPAELGNADTLYVGDPVYAIGNPLGVELRGTLTNGIVSAIDRKMMVDGEMYTVIQTNAALNFGNSGGPLINAYGQVVGVNSIKMASGYRYSDSVEGLGFALPISSELYMINDMIRYGEIRAEGVLGIVVLTEMETLPNGVTGVRILLVDENGAGDKAGLREDDIITAVYGKPIESSEEFLRIRRGLEPGDELSLRVYRSGAYLDMTAVLEAAE